MKPVPYTQTYPKPALCISTICKISEPYDPSIDTEPSNDSDLNGWVIFPERNGTLFMQNEQHDAGINIGYKDFSYYVNKDGKVSGENGIKFTAKSLIDTIRKICA